MSGRRAAGLLAAAAGLGLLGARFFGAAHESLARTRGSACRALDPDPVPPALRDREAPDFDLPDASGARWSLKKLRGRPVLLNFWATWCPPCAEEMPSMEELTKRLPDPGPVVLAVTVDDGWEAVRRFFGNGTKMSVLLDEKREVPKLYGTEKFPETYLIDAEGRVRQYFINKRDWSKPEALACIESLR